ncbi:MAG: M28 family peptidase, partial [bacterium]|nr:M28 family peptidase [bacterium]
LKIKSFKNRIGPDVIDDHRPLIEIGIPIIAIIDFDYDPWHTSEDTPDKCSPESLRQIGVLLLDLVYNGL